MWLWEKRKYKLFGYIFCKQKNSNYKLNTGFSNFTIYINHETYNSSSVKSIKLGTGVRIF